MTNTLTGYDVLVYVKMLKQRHTCIQNVIIERLMTVFPFVLHGEKKVIQVWNDMRGE